MSGWYLDQYCDSVKFWSDKKVLEERTNSDLYGRKDELITLYPTEADAWAAARERAIKLSVDVKRDLIKAENRVKRCMKRCEAGGKLWQQS